MTREVIFNVNETTGEDMTIFDRLVEFPEGKRFLSKLEDKETVYKDGQHYANFLYDPNNKEFVFIVSGDDTYGKEDSHMIMWTSDDASDIYKLFRELSIKDTDPKRKDAYEGCLKLMHKVISRWLRENQPFLWDKTPTL